MSAKKNPFSSRWDQPLNSIRITRKDALLLFAYDMLQTTLIYKEILIEMELSLYLPALECWCQKYPQYARTLMETAIQMNEDLEQTGQIPVFAVGFCLGVFAELDVLVNGESANNLAQLTRFC